MNPQMRPILTKPSEAIDLVCVSTDLAHFAVEIVVCIPTFQRPAMLERTLQSLVEQQGVARFAVVIVDNDAANAAGARAAAAFFADKRLSGLCFVESQQGNCHAINRAFSEARRRFRNASYFLMIDDDEYADPNWIAMMVGAAKSQSADVVGGPVFPDFPANAPRQIASHPIYWPAFSKSGFVPMIYGSGNCLITRRAFDALDNPNFDLGYNFLGGGDTDFFTRCRKAGLISYWEHRARIAEIVPNERLQRGWILRRGLRIGAINYRIDQSSSQTFLARARLVAKNIALLPVSVGRALKLAARREHTLIVAHPFVIALGRIFAAVGLEPEQYRLNKESAK